MFEKCTESMRAQTIGFDDGCTVETLESQMVKKYMWYYHYARGKSRAEFSMPDELFFKTDPEREMHTICRYALLDRNF